MSKKAFAIVDTIFGKAFLPDFSLKAEVFLRPIGEIAFDQLNGFFDGEISIKRNQQMEMVRHNGEFVNFEFTGIRAKYINE